MKFVLPAALVIAVSLAGYAAMGGPEKAPSGPVPWHNPDKAPAEPMPGQTVGRGIQPRQVGVRVSAPFQLPASWNKDPLYNEWYVMVEDPSFPLNDPRRFRAKKLNDPF